MALFQPLDGNRSGSVAGTTFSHNAGGSYVRRRSVPVNPTSTRQTVVRGNMSTNARGWNALTDPQRAAWKAYGQSNPVRNRLGASIKLSGISSYTRINNVSRDSGSGTITSAPSGVGPGALLTVSITANTSTTVTVAFTPTPVGAARRIAVWWTGPGRASVNPNQRQARLVAYSALNAATGVSITLPAAASAGDVSNFYIGVVDSNGRLSQLTKVRYTFV